eukprot:13124763-Ditylum_brightwellii.AAC.1
MKRLIPAQAVMIMLDNWCVAEDLMAAYSEDDHEYLPVPNAMLDFAWLDPGKVILIEVNPIADGLGSFRGSTGLLGYEEDV